MHLSTAHKQRLLQAARLASAGALVLSTLGTALTSSAYASQLVQHSTTISDSRPSTTNVTYTVSFQPPSGSLATAINRIDFKFCTAADTFSASCTAPTGFNDGASATASGFGGSSGNSPGTYVADTANTAHFTITTPTTETAIAHKVVFSAVTNPSVSQTYYVRVQTASDSAGAVPIDSGESAFAILSSVQVSGRVLESMTFTVASVATATACGTGADTSTVASSTTSIPFGNFVSGTPRVACQTVNTATNALNGYTTTVAEVDAATGNATSGVGGMCRQTATACTADGATAGVATSDVIMDCGAACLDTTARSWTNGTTFGLGLNANGTQASGTFGGVNKYRSLFNDTTAIPVATSSGPTTGANTFVVYKADVNSAQTAGVYQNSVEYVSTPTF